MLQNLNSDFARQERKNSAHYFNPSEKPSTPNLETTYGAANGANRPYMLATFTIRPATNSDILQSQFLTNMGNLTHKKLECVRSSDFLISWHLTNKNRFIHFLDLLFLSIGPREVHRTTNQLTFRASRGSQ